MVRIVKAWGWMVALSLVGFCDDADEIQIQGSFAPLRMTTVITG
jgi:hypothetical protein